MASGAKFRSSTTRTSLAPEVQQVKRGGWVLTHPVNLLHQRPPPRDIRLSLSLTPLRETPESSRDGPDVSTQSRSKGFRVLLLLPAASARNIQDCGG